MSITPLLPPDSRVGAPTRPRAAHRVLPRAVRHRWLTLLVGAAVVAGAVVLLSGGMTTTEPDEQLVGDSAAAARITDSADFGRRPTENVVISSATPAAGRALNQAAAASAVEDLVSAYRGLDGVATVGEAMLSPDGTTMLLPVQLDAATGTGSALSPAGSRTPGEAVVPMLAATERVAAEHPGLRIGQVGPGSIDSEVAEQLDADFRRAELISLPVTLLILLAAFGAVVAAGVPVLLGIGAVVVSLGLTALASRHLLPVDPNAQPMVLLIGLAVGVDYALFVLRRSREERARGASSREAIAISMRTAGRAVLISGITVVVAMSGMLVAGGLFTSLAIGTLLVVAAAVVASATVLPALLSLLGDRVEALRLPLRRRTASGSESRAWGALASRVTRRPVIWASLTAAVLMALAAPALGMRTALPGAESLPSSFASVDAYNRLSAAFPQNGTTVDVVVGAPAADADRVVSAMDAAFPTATALPHVVGESPEVEASLDRTVHVLRLAVPLETSDPAMAGVVEQVRTGVVPAISSALAGTRAQVHVGGAAEASDLSVWMDQRLAWVVGFVLALTVAVMLVSFGSVWLALATVALNLLSVGAAYGVMTLVFQHTWAEPLLGFTSIGSVASWIPLILFVILFGLSMDYHVFVVSRVREAFTDGADAREAVRAGVARSAGVVTSAAVVMVAVFSIFATLNSLEMKQLGVGLATAILLDATLVRGALLPAVLALLGRRAHTGPSWLPTLHH